MAGKIASVYLLIYNAFQMFGWSAIFFVAANHIFTTGSYDGLWKKCEVMLQLFQTAAIMEVIHCLVKIVPSNWIITAIQVASRLLIVWGIIYLVKETENSLGVPMLVIAWSMAEITRSSFYFLKILDFCPYFLTWCRYTFFIILYPMGVLGEVLTIVDALPIVKTGKYNLYLPNSLNMSFSYYYLLLSITCSYVPGLFKMYTHMLHQRSKILFRVPLKKD